MIISKRKQDDGSWVRTVDGVQAAPPVTRNERVRVSRHRERVGTALKELIAWVLQIKATSTCQCQTLADEMDTWGIQGCESRREYIVTRLVSQRDQLAESLKSQSLAHAAIGWTGGLGLVPDFVLRQGANWLLSQAIAKVPPRPVPQPATRPQRSGRAASRDPIRDAFRSLGGPARFITMAQLQADTLLLASKIPPDVTAIAGVARSGLSVATMLAMLLHLPMITIRQTMHDIVPTGNGWRLGGSRHVEPRGKILVVDDTVMTGNSLKAIRPLVEAQLPNAIYAAVYVNPLADRKPEIWAVDLPWPHLLEWNLFNSVLSPSVAMDFDGILCRDCPPGDDDDGPRYEQFIRHAQPHYTPRKVAVPLIVTARIEKYRSLTEEWLRRHGIHWQKLVMHPASSLRERQRDDIPAYKARHFAQWNARHRAMPGPSMFIESEDWQAQRIAKLSKGLVICPATARTYYG